ncbi:Fic family protein [Elusimicrobium simillimum]|uniref:Fic family protein n=1 Tax=Elusimicrobium simillimum TaxID=3143438 RepID=UPI003C70464E
MNWILENIIKKNKQLSKILRNSQAKEELKKWLLTELTYTSNHIEGNTLTRHETEMAITEGITTAEKPIKDYIEATNHADAFKLVLELASKKEDISENDILKIHKEVLKGINEEYAGRYRTVRVRISGSTVIMPNPLKVPDLMEKFVKHINSKDLSVPEMALDAHFKFVSIHPFIDGNGRVGRLLMNLILLKGGYWPIIIRPRDRKQYINSIEKGQLTESLEQYNNFMFKAFERTIDTYIDMFDNSKPDVQHNKLMKISEFAKAAGLPVSTIRYYLRVGKIKPVSKTQGDYMLFLPEQVSEIKKK